MEVAASLRGFHARYNAALYEMLALEGERARLRGEGRLLEGLLTRFLGGVQVLPGDMERDDNTLMRVVGLGGAAVR